MKTAFEILQSKLTIADTSEFREIHIPEILDAMEKYKAQFPQQEISDDQAIKMLQDMNKQPMRFHCVPKEISDEEIEEVLFHHSNEYAIGFKDAIKWYREQLKQRQ